MDISELLGKTLKGVIVSSDEMRFVVNSGETYRLFHHQDCCESVTIDDVCGDVKDLLWAEILEAECIHQTSENPPGVHREYQDSFTWTFYKIGTSKGSVVVRWYGESNGYYSERVDFELMAQ